LYNQQTRVCVIYVVVIDRGNEIFPPNNDYSIAEKVYGITGRLVGTFC